MRIAVVVATLLTAVSSQELLSSHRETLPEYSHFAVKQSQVNKGPDEKKLFKSLKENYKKLNGHNKGSQSGADSFDGAVAKLSHQLENDGAVKEEKNLGSTIFVKDGITAEDTIDWRTRGVVTPIKDEGICGSGWAFSAIGALEGQLAIKKGRLIPLSEQQLIDCSLSYGNRGCRGGYISRAYEYLMSGEGVVASSSYPYRAQDGTCNINEGKVEAQIIGVVNIDSGDEDALKKAISSVGPVTAMIQANLWEFKNYKSGVYNNTACTGEALDHAVLVIGYGTTPEGLHYWIIKNSWGTDWGEGGYMRMSRNRGNLCGIASKASFPVLKLTGNDS